MHELYIAESILKSVKKSLSADLKPEEVIQIYIEVGKLDAVVPDTLHFLHNAIRGNFGMAKAELCITEIPVEGECNDCSLKFTIEEPLFLCPHCGSGEVTVLKGRGISLMKIVVEDK